MNIFDRIKNIEIQGAINIAIESLKYLKRFAIKNGFGSAFDRECEKLLKTRPTAVAIFNVISEVKKDKSIEKINELLDEIEKSKKGLEKNGKKIFKKKSVIMTHCHSSGVVALLKANRNKIKSVIVTETRPKHQGLITAKELIKAKIPVIFIIDSAIGYYMKDVDMVLFGSDSIRKEGIINKIGTLALAITAKEFNKPVYVIASSLKIDKRKKYEIEMRNPNEIHKPIKGIKILNPAFDETSYRCISKIVTEKGIMKPKEVIKELMVKK